MGWTYLAESEDSPLPWHPGLDLSPIVKTIDTPRECCSPVCETEPCPWRQSGMMCAIFKAALFQGSTSSTVVSLARTSALRAMEQAWQESEAAYFLRSRDSLARFDQASSSWKTCLPFGPVGPTLLPEDWPSFGMTVAGECFPLLTWERRTSESDGGCSQGAMIPTATDSKGSRNATVKNRKSAGNSGTTLTDYVTMFPTPAATSYGTNQGGGMGRSGKVRPSLETMARQGLWPTPGAADGARGGGQPSRALDPNRQFTLNDAVKLWPTPLSRDGKGSGKHGNGTDTLPSAVGGSLNPEFVEWLQAYPIGWTVCADWVMQFVRPKRVKHLKDSRESKEIA